MTSIQALVVDDSRSARKVLERMLQKANVSVSTVEDAESALAYLQQETPSIVFMDHMMPGMNGFEATQALRQMPHLRDVPTIMYTSKDDSDYLAQAKAHGANDVLCKPAKQDKLQAIIDLYLSSAPKVDTQVNADSLSPVAEQALIEQETTELDTHQSENSHDAADLKAHVVTQPDLNVPSNNDLTLFVQQQLRQPLRSVNDSLLQTIEETSAQHTATLNTQIEQLQLAWDEKLQTAVQQSKVSPSALFKTLQPILQKLSLQVANKVVAHHQKTQLEPLRDALESSRQELTQLTEQLSTLQQQQAQALSQQKRLTLAALATAAFALAGVAALVANSLS